MFWYIGGIFAGFAIGYVVALSQNRKRGGYKKGVNDCRNCKNLNVIHHYGTVDCKKFSLPLPDMPKVCTVYQHIGNKEGDP